MDRYRFPAQSMKQLLAGLVLYRGGAEASRATAGDLPQPSPTSNFNRRTSLILRTDNLLAGKLIVPFEGEAACHCVVQRRLACGNHSGEAERCSGIGLKLFGFIAEPVFACSRTRLNGRFAGI
jgi:hypothetical protein